MIKTSGAILTSGIFVTRSLMAAILIGKQAMLVIALIAFLTAGENRAARFLVFEGVRNVGISRKMQWGPSTRVNRIYRTK
jgi:hypothetical protein